MRIEQFDASQTDAKSFQCTADKANRGKKCFDCYLGVFRFNVYSQLIDRSRFWATKLNGLIKCHNCPYCSLRNTTLS